MHNKNEAAPVFTANVPFSSMVTLPSLLLQPVVLLLAVAIGVLCAWPFLCSWLGFELFSATEFQADIFSVNFLLSTWSVSLLFLFAGLLSVAHLFVKPHDVSVPLLGFGFLGYGFIEVYQLLVVFLHVDDSRTLAEMWWISRLFFVVGFIVTVMIALSSIRIRQYSGKIGRDIFAPLAVGFCLIGLLWALFFLVSNVKGIPARWLWSHPGGLSVLLFISLPLLIFLCKKTHTILSVGVLLMVLPAWALEAVLISTTYSFATVLYLKFILGLIPLVAITCQFFLSYRSLNTAKIELLGNQLKLDDALRTLIGTNERLLHANSHDQLTGVGNREYFFAEAERAVARAKRSGQRVGFLYLDLNKFKQVNDSYGHAVGDEVLCEFSARIKTVMRKEDCLARVGGDEFILMVENVGELENLIVITEKMIALLKQPVATTKGELDCGVSIGVSAFPETKQVADLIKHADIAMYKAKNKETSQFQLYTEELSAQHREDLFIQTELPIALKAGQFSLVYQPIYRVNNVEWVGVEVLLRWQHPEKGFIPPDKFIPIAERSMFINTLGKWIIEEACKQLHRWREDHNLAVYLSVNVSVRQLYSDSLISTIKRCCEQYCLAPEYIIFEITEGQLIQDLQSCQGMIAELKKLGIRLALDDYGSGYASITHLRNLPIDSLKLDRSLIQNVHLNVQNQVLTRTTIELAHSLGLTVIAEGIEEAGEFALLRDSQCDFVQGYYFSRPLAPVECTEFFLAEQACTTEH